MSLDRYTIGKCIGKGSYGEVFLSKHKKDKKQYVLKKVDLQKASVRERKAAELEAKLLSQLRHPNIVSYRESFQDDTGFLYIAMNFCEGGDLYSRLKAQKGIPLDENQIVEWFVQIAMALQYMHEKHILHRDLKTQNIFLTKSKIIKVGDLGIARVLESSSDMATTLIGTPYYMSPELFSNKPYNHKSDVWALGCCLYEMCTLRHAFNAKDMSSLVYKILKGKTPPLPKQYSTDLCSIIKSMLDQDPDKRPSASRLLRHPYIKKQIALFLEGTKNRQKQRKNLISERIEEVSSNEPSSKSQSQSSDPSLHSSIATVSGVDCVIEEPSSPPRLVPRQRSKEPSSPARSSVESNSSSSSTSSSEKGQTEIHVHDSAEQKKKLERQRELIKKQMAERRRSERSNKEQQRNNLQADERGNQEDEKKPVPRARSAGSVPKSPAVREEAPSRPSSARRPLPRPPVLTPRSKGNPSISNSPRSRRRYKVSSGIGHHQTSADDDDEDDDKSTASVDSDKSLQSANESTPQSGSMSARERRRMKQRSSDVMSPAVSLNAPPLPSPRDLIAAARVRKSQEGMGDVTPRSSSRDRPNRSSYDSVDGPRPKPVTDQVPVDSSGSDSTGSDLEEVTVDEPASQQPQVRKHRHLSDVSSLINQLETTLKVVDRSADDRESPAQSPSPTNEPPTFPCGASPTTSGRLRDRIDRLRSDCIHGIGESQLTQALRIIEALEEDDVEDALIDLMGRDKFEQFGGAIWQLKFCEDFQVS
ncbi:serine/threonine-protein kinase Nek4 [Nematostella vectensis]|uniref:serine/threonine-protein kinase Nek4 n=1 Tax=Nematostella vectensis TaxID=45351 RepID=UPI002077112C|nr:serine/threonine-protein kinase Nek4 [Nematostella vectensis]